MGVLFGFFAKWWDHKSEKVTEHQFHSRVHMPMELLLFLLSLGCYPTLFQIWQKFFLGPLQKEGIVIIDWRR